ncbi:MAG TPA: SAM-dependent methyltransferase [Prosthecobacter sp.]|nr:SAM-dependent methyltransferase [Prosthecobacter sp.]
MSEAEPFSVFMARALRDYYGRNIRTVGARGDFSTSATLSPLLGQSIAAWLLEESRLQPSIRHLIEVGPGDGSLTAQVRRSLGWWRRRRFQFHLVETSPVLRARQEARLGRFVRWHEDMASALSMAEGSALIYHNELLDAFPVTLIQRHADQWHEVYVNGGREELRPLLLDGTGFSTLGAWQPPPNQRCELQAAVRQWLAEWTPLWRAGAMLTIDYGDLFPALYHRRPAGTLRAYLLQQRLEGSAIYNNPGRQDLTADVNFTDYRAWLQAFGCEESGYGTQAEFIQARSRTADAEFIVNPDGAGQAFKYVIHRRLRK